MHSDQDLDLLRRARKFERHALAEIYDRYSPEIYRYAWRLLGQEDLVEECVAETFSRLLNALKDGGGPNRYLRAYLYRTAHNWVSDLYRREPGPSVSLEDVQVPDPGGGPAQQADQATELRQLRAALSKLTPDQRQVVVLKYLEGWSNAQVAQALDKPVGAVKSLHHRAIQSLRQHLSIEEEVNE